MSVAISAAAKALSPRLARRAVSVSVSVSVSAALSKSSRPFSCPWRAAAATTTMTFERELSSSLSLSSSSSSSSFFVVRAVRTPASSRRPLSSPPIASEATAAVLPKEEEEEEEEEEDKKNRDGSSLGAEDFTPTPISSPMRCPVHSQEPLDRSRSEAGVAWAEGVDPSVHYKHCATCTCGAVNVEETPSLSSSSSLSAPSMATCDISSRLADPLPPPLPEPVYSFHKRVMPSNLTALSSPAGKRLFLESLQGGNAESYFPLAEQFMNQSDPAFCGVTTLCMTLNAMSVDPNVRWRGGWRWYGDDSVVLANCCLDMERVRRAGICMEEFVSLGRCQGARVTLKRPLLPPPSSLSLMEEEKEKSLKQEGTRYGLDQFRSDICFMVRNPPQYASEGEEKASPPSPDDLTAAAGATGEGGFLVVSYSRSALNQTGEGHFSPVAAYHPPTDRALVLDVARFKYAPYWVGVEELYRAMIPPDSTTGLSRGWLLMYPPKAKPTTMLSSSLSAGGGGGGGWGGWHGGTAKTDEGKRPAETVRMVGEGDICPVGEIKVEFCRAAAGGTRAGAAGAAEAGNKKRSKSVTVVGDNDRHDENDDDDEEEDRRPRLSVRRPMRRRLSTCNADAKQDDGSVKSRGERGSTDTTGNGSS